jgi:hypothetical protein
METVDLVGVSASDGAVWYQNIVFWSALVGWMLAQCMKMLGNFIRTRRIDFRYLVSTGGMPSAHSAMVSALATAVACECGLGSPIFAVTAALACIVMFDAQSVRRAAGMQAQLLNQIVDEIFTEKHVSQTKLKELLGHTPKQVYAGAITGMAVAIGLHYLFGHQ